MTGPRPPMTRPHRCLAPMTRIAKKWLAPMTRSHGWLAPARRAMTRPNWWVAPARVALVGLLLPLLGGDCGGGDGSGGDPAVREVEAPPCVGDCSGGGDPPPDLAAPDPVCAAVSSPFPPGFDFAKGGSGIAWVADFSPPTLIPFSVDASPPRIADTHAPFTIPFDSDGDGRNEGSATLPLAPVLDDIRIVASDLALVTASGYEEVIFFSPDAGSLREFEVAVPAGFAPGDNPLLPSPGSSAPRTGLSTFACVRPPAGAVDSVGESIADAVPTAAFCDRSTPSYYASFTSGATLAGAHLFVSTSNLGDGAGSAETQYLPGTVLVYDIDLDAVPPTVSPDAVTPVIFTASFNPTHVTAYRRGARDFVLVTASGGIGIAADDPSTPEIEGGAVALTPASIDVIDAQSLELVATIPLGLAALAGGPLAIDASGRVAITGSVAARHLLGVDLAALDTLPGQVAAPVVLDGSDGVDARIFDAGRPLVVPALAGGAPPESCPGSTTGSSFNAAGDLLFATEFCDGTLGLFAVDLSGSPPVPLPGDRFELQELLPIAAPLRADTLGEARAPGRVRVRAGTPGVDYEGRDLLLLIGQPEGLLCAVGIESS